jgi:formamidopyrimidine-DNA glycosylase
MPELPEVETIKTQLHQHLIGKEIKNIEVRKAKMFSGDYRLLIGKKIIDLNRRAKMIIFSFNQNLLLLTHLKMTGQLIYRKPGQIGPTPEGPNWSKGDNQGISKHTHVIFYFTDNSRLYFNDSRQFGYMKLIEKAELDQIKAFREFGIEPFDPNFTFDQFGKILKKNNKARIKALLIDQTIIAGIGNIYSDEILFEAGIFPGRKVNSLNKNEQQKLYQSIKKILKTGLKLGGASDSAYLNALGLQGDFIDFTRVYRREGEPCKICKSKIKRIKFSGRSSFYCLKCQK